MIPLRPCGPDLRPFDRAKLFESPMIHFNRPNIAGNCFTLGFPQAQVTGRPLFRVTVWGVNPKYPDHAIAFEMKIGAPCVRGHRVQRTIAGLGMCQAR